MTPWGEKVWVLTSRTVKPPASEALSSASLMTCSLSSRDGSRTQSSAMTCLPRTLPIPPVHLPPPKAPMHHASRACRTLRKRLHIGRPTLPAPRD